MNKAEEWRAVPGYEGLYEISDYGNVKSLVGWNGKRYVPREKILTKTMTSTGYYKVEIVRDGVRKSKKVHRLVGLAFIPNPDNKPYINHKDGNPLNNCIENLEWCTQKENIRHALKTGLIKSFDSNIEDVVKLYHDEGYTLQEIAELFGVTKTTVRRSMERCNVKRRSISEANDKHGIDLNKLRLEFEEGKTNKELAKKYNCSSNLIAVRRYQMKKRGA